MKIDTLNKYWEVTVKIDGEPIITISSNHVAGLEDLEPYKDVIEICANNLLCFVGSESNCVPSNCITCSKNQCHLQFNKTACSSYRRSEYRMVPYKNLLDTASSE